MSQDTKVTKPSLFDSIDWGEAWKEAQEKRRKPDNSGFWDGRAPEFAKKSGLSAYSKAFLEYAALEPEETVFDMGCGAGTLSLPLARAGHTVTAVDFSPKMLEALQESMATEGIKSIRTIQASWEDDWKAANIEPADVAFASRSIAVRDLRAALIKLDAMAKRRVCLTLSAGTAPRHDPLLWEALGRETIRDGDYIYCYNILYQLGIIPECRIITTNKTDSYKTFEEACASIRRALGTTTPEEDVLLEAFCTKHLTRTTDSEGCSLWARDYDLPVDWIFISWNKD
jgi:SAM-dependent methyltransferase